ncbi:dnaA protein [Aureimonas altamirensis DSM 21988]|uniref:Hda lid domain-containing protein n=2 Tax=Aureimonas altamirensis TaxID=370622 RepID=A0A0N7KXA4_9HYPH|nr:DnaA/Hda family protein [Aureimonas altamirensis]BAT26369.1 hypothetical protein [Aureimonas altamirensis]SHJ45550.1 dnaA protein [Aureimonas altamirensis DSM 21988]
MSTTRQLPFELPHNASFDRADLIESDANQLAIEAIDSWPAWPHPVLLIAGPVGSGKTHIAEAFAAMSGGRHARAGDVFEPQSGFVRVIDDVDRTDMAEEEIFAIVNAARAGLGHVLLTSRTPAPLLHLRLPDLASRLRAATQIELGAPDDMLLHGVLVKLFADRQMDVDPKLLAYILSRMERSIASAEALVARLDRESLASGRRITRAMVASVLEDGEA